MSGFSSVTWSPAGGSGTNWFHWGVEMGSQEGSGMCSGLRGMDQELGQG